MRTKYDYLKNDKIESNDMEKKEQYEFEDYSFTVAPWPLIPEGKYQARCIHAEKGRSHANSEKLFLHFQIIDGQYFGERLFMAINLTDNKGQLKKDYGLRSKLYESWVIANNNQRPPRKDRLLSTQIFKNRIFEVKVRTVKPKNDDGSEKQECFHYSVVDRLIERLA